MFTLKGMLHISGSTLALFSTMHLYSDNQQCFNYVHLSLIWISLEVTCFFMWVLTEAIIMWYFIVEK